MNVEQQKAHVFGSLFVIANKLQKLGDRLDPEVTVKQWLFIAAVSQFTSAPALSELAKHIGYSRQNAKRIAQSLTQRGLINLSTDSLDKRSQRISMTDACRKHFAERTQKEAAFVQTLFADMDDGEVSILFTALGKLETNIQRMESAHGQTKED